MAQLRSYTTIEQSKRLAEFLPIESADMYYPHLGGGQYGETPRVGNASEMYSGKPDIHCWSLSALLNVINKDFYPNLFHDGEAWNLTATYHDDNTIKYDTCGDDPLDNIYRMIVFLHEQKLI